MFEYMLYERENSAAALEKGFNKKATNMCHLRWVACAEHLCAKCCLRRLAPYIPNI